jgi:DNA-binding MarR family transcriptional regulator
MVESIDHQLTQFDITTAQFTVLAMLAENSPETAAQLCRENSYDRGAMTRMLDRLQTKNFINRVRSTDDRRVVKLELTERGRKVYPTLRTCSSVAIDQMLQGIEQKDIEHVEFLLEKMLANK